MKNILRLLIIIVSALIIATGIGGNGCLWSGNGQSGDTMMGSSGANRASSPSPANGALNVAPNASLSWASVSGMVSYDIALGTVNPPTSYVANVPNSHFRTSYKPALDFQYNTTYFWRVDSNDSLGLTYMGYVWTFSTANQELEMTNPNPANSATDIPITSTLTWGVLDGAANYDVYFGINNPPSFITRVTPGAYHPHTLSYNTTYFWRVKARNGAGAVICTGPVWNFRTMWIPQPAANPSPFNGAINCYNTSVLSWATLAGTPSYKVYLGTDNPPPFVASVHKKTYRTSYNPGTLAYGTTYYWRVDSKDNSGRIIAGPIWTFSTVPSLPAQAGTPNPAYNAADQAVNTILSWAAAPGAESYHVYFSKTSTLSYRTNTGSTSYNPGVLLYGTQYYWRIDAKNTTGVTTGIIWSFSTRAPLLPVRADSPYPADGTANWAATTQFSWASGSDATAYDVYLGTTNNPSLVQADIPKAVYRTRYNPGALLFNTIYYWRVDAKNGGGSTAGAIWSFTTMPPLPSQVGSGNPASGVIDCLPDLSLSWGGASRASSYDVYLAVTNTIVPGDRKANTLSLSYKPSGLLFNTTYYWRVDSRNSTGIVVGQVWSFSTLSVPGKAISVAPAGNADDVLDSAALEWTAAVRAESYNVYFGTSLTPELELYANVLSPTVSYTPPKDWNTRYYWRIDAMNASGTTVGDLQTFTTLSAPAQVSAPPVFPGLGQAGVSINPVLEWTAAARASSYDIYFGIGSPGAFKVNQTGATYSPGALEPNTVYYWRIDSKNAVGTTAGNVWSFTTLHKPDQVTGPTPADNATGILNGQQLSWSSAAGATSYDIYFGTSSPGAFKVNQISTSFSPGLLVSNAVYYWRIDSRNEAGPTTGTVWSFITLATPARVVNPTPANNATGIADGQQLSWSAAAGATSYDIYFGTVSPGEFMVNQDGAYDPGPLAYGTTYYWRIDSRNAAGVTTGTVWTFTTANSGSLPSQVIGLDPSENDSVSVSHDLIWEIAAGATSYDVYLGTVLSDVLNATVATVGIFKGNQADRIYDPPGDMLPQHTYYWRIDARNSFGVTKGVVWTFTTKNY